MHARCVAHACCVAHGRYGRTRLTPSAPSHAILLRAIRQAAIAAVPLGSAASLTNQSCPDCSHDCTAGLDCEVTARHVTAQACRTATHGDARHAGSRSGKKAGGQPRRVLWPWPVRTAHSTRVGRGHGGCREEHKTELVTGLGVGRGTRGSGTQRGACSGQRAFRLLVPEALCTCVREERHAYVSGRHAHAGWAPGGKGGGGGVTYVGRLPADPLPGARPVPRWARRSCGPMHTQR